MFSLNSPQSVKKQSMPIDTKPAKNRVRRTRRAIVFLSLIHSLKLTSDDAGLPKGQKTGNIKPLVGWDYSLWYEIVNRSKTTMFRSLYKANYFIRASKTSLHCFYFLSLSGLIKELINEAAFLSFFSLTIQCQRLNNVINHFPN